jgi:hypothetical protein
VTLDAVQPAAVDSFFAGTADTAAVASAAGWAFILG